MIAGVVNADFEATIPLTVRGPSGRLMRIRAVIDTGYDGHLSLPPAVVAELGLAWQQNTNATLADGSSITFATFEGAVVWNRRNRTISVDEAEMTPLVGTALLASHAFNAEFRPGGKVAIKSLRRRRG
jgi:clan AA aspartic protease